MAKLSREESINRYGTEAYTAWDEPGANADALSKGINVMQKQPNPAQLNQTVKANQFTPIKGFSDIQNKYAESLSQQPDYQGLYKTYSQQEGLTEVNKLITNIDNTVADIEDKIAKIEPSINKEIGDYLITEGQRGRMITAEQEPLRTQYADILRSRSRLSAEATAKSNLVNTLMSYAKTGYEGNVGYLKALVDIEKSNKDSNLTKDFTKYLNEPSEPKPKTPFGSNYEKLADDIFKNVTLDESGAIKTEAKPKQVVDATGNVKLGKDVKLSTNKNKSLLYLAGK